MEFNPYSDSFFDDPYDTYRWMRDEAPVYYSERWDFYALTRNSDVVAAHHKVPAVGGNRDGPDAPGCRV